MLPAHRNFLKRQASVSECPAPLATLRHLLGVLLPDSPPNHGVTVIYLYLPWFPVVPNSCTANSETPLRKKLEQDPPLDAIGETLSRRHTRAESFPPKANILFLSACTLYMYSILENTVCAPFRAFNLSSLHCTTAALLPRFRRSLMPSTSSIKTFSY